MTRKHFEAIAETFRFERQTANAIVPTHGGQRKTAVETIDRLAKQIASDLAGTNPNFNRSRFLEACGVED
jgi:hypothetical protein